MMMNYAALLVSAFLIAQVPVRVVKPVRRDGAGGERS